jgi:hypothetical protein
MDMDGGRRHHSQLFTVRLWAEDLGDGRAEWRGKLERVASGEAHYFRDWSTLISLLVTMLPDIQIARLLNDLDDQTAGAPSDEETLPSL